MSRRLLLLPSLLLALSTFGQVTVSPSTANFFTVYTDEVDSLTLTLTNTGSTPYSVKDVNLYHPAFRIPDTSFTISAGGSHHVKVYCEPRHNMRYADYLYIIPTGDPRPVAVFTYAFTRHRQAYYDPTHNLENEELKTALHNLISTGTTDLGYNTARDKMFMEFDNWKVNGHGASVNTLHCVYTDSVAVGYTSRSDAQTNYQFNTEHTFPQSFFGGVSPMLSDMHHLFPTKDFANSERANKPFGVVTSPTWSNSGSKSNSTTFEPKDEHKGNAARAILYFVMRYQDYSNFCDPQEPTLYDWTLGHLPTSWDSIRNEDIYALQGNRNPFVDHPEFLERIASVCSVDSGYTGPVAWWTGDTLQFGSVPASTSSDGLLHVSNQGRKFLTLSGFTFSDPAFSLVGTPSATISTDSLETFTIRFTPTSPSTSYSGTLTITTNDAWHPTLTIPLNGNSFPVSTLEPNPSEWVLVYPQPASDFVRVSCGSPLMEVELLDAAGRQLLRMDAGRSTEIEFATQALSPGSYLLRLFTQDSVLHRPLMILK